MQNVLVVDDEPIVRDVIGRYLERSGFRALQTGDGGSVLPTLRTHDVSLIVLDVMMPGTDGFEVCRAVRSEFDVPIILLSARGEEVDRIVGLEIGADDYVTKPCSPRELVLRVKTVLRRGGMPGRPTPLVAGDVSIDPTTRDVRRGGTTVSLTAKEFDLLYFLAQHPRHVFSREHLMERIWGSSGQLEPATITVHIRRLREKIEHDPSAPTRIETVWGVGYRFVA